MSSDLAGTRLCLSKSRFIQVIAKCLNISCKEVRTACTDSANAFTSQKSSSFRLALCGYKVYHDQIHVCAAFKRCWWCLQELEAVRDAFSPPLACAAAKIGDIEALEALKQMVSHTVSHLNTVVNRARGCVNLQTIALTPNNLSKSVLVLQITLDERHLDDLMSWNSVSMVVFVQYFPQCVALSRSQLISCSDSLQSTCLCPSMCIATQGAKQQHHPGYRTQYEPDQLIQLIS